MTEEVRFAVEGTSTTVSGILLRPRRALALYVLAHGAGARMHHPFLESIAEGLADRGIGTLRYQFPYMEEGKRYPDPRLAGDDGPVRRSVRLGGNLPAPLVRGGEVAGGRMTSRAAVEKALPGVQGLVFLGFPLHAPGKPSGERADHLVRVEHPMLFLQGTRDALAHCDLIESVVGRLGRRGFLHFLEGGDHSFNVLKRSGRDSADVLDELLRTTVEWATRLTDSPS